MTTRRLIAAALIAVQALVVWHTTASPLVPLAAVALAAGALVVRPRKVSRWAWLGIFAACVVAMLIKQAVAPLVSGVAASDRYDEWSLLLAELLLLVQSLALADAGARRWPALVALVALVCAFRQTAPPASETPLLAAAIGAVLLVGWQLAAREQGAAPASLKSFAPQRWLCVLLLAASGILAWLLVPAWKWGLAQLEHRSPAWVAAAAGRSTFGRYVESGSLAAVTEAQLADPQRTVLVVYCDRAPGYLRGRVFDTYRRGRWLAPRMSHELGGAPLARTVRALASSASSGSSEFQKENLFALTAAPGPSLETMRAMTIENEPSRGKVYFLPLGTALVRGAGTSIGIDQHEVILAGLSTNHTYTAYRPAGPASATLSPQLAERLAQPLDELDPAVARLAERVAGQRRTTSEKIAAVEAFFRQQFTYSTEPMSIPADVEPLSHFLLQRPPAHCEFFASGAAALLRHAGVPCRYVTGYVVTELDEETGDYWLARNRNAHAWIEAYDAERRQWVIVEATPGIDVPDEADEADADQLAASATASAAASNDDGSWGLSWNTLGSWLDFAPGLALGALLATTLIYFWRSPRASDPRLRMLHGKLRRLDRAARRRGLRRSRHETLHQFARRIAGHAPGDEALAACAAQYEAYASERYRPSPS